MSTILKALKQAEKDCSDQENEISPSFNVRAVLSPRMQQKSSKFSNLSRAVISLAVVSLVAIVSYALFFINKNNQPQTSSPAELSQVLDTKPVMEKGQKQIVAPAIKSFDPPRPLNELVLKPEPVSKALSKKGKEKNSAPLDTDFFKKNEKKLFNPSIKQKITPEDPAPLIVEAPTSGQSKMKDSAKDEKEVLNAKSLKQIILPLENNRLTVQAISWDQSQANRIAVIDNSVLREGDFVQGYRLVRIEEDSVILHYSGNDYRLGFRYR
jgi:cytoskeletal protein RodZ